MKERAEGARAITIEKEGNTLTLTMHLSGHQTPPWPPSHPLLMFCAPDKGVSSADASCIERESPPHFLHALPLPTLMAVGRAGGCLYAGCGGASADLPTALLLLLLLDEEAAAVAVDCSCALVASSVVPFGAATGVSWGCSGCCCWAEAACGLARRTASVTGTAFEEAGAAASSSFETLCSLSPCVGVPDVIERRTATTGTGGAGFGSGGGGGHSGVSSFGWKRFVFTSSGGLGISCGRIGAGVFGFGGGGGGTGSEGTTTRSLGAATAVGGFCGCGCGCG